jgi:hypothetical protein
MAAWFWIASADVFARDVNRAMGVGVEDDKAAVASPENAERDCGNAREVEDVLVVAKGEAFAPGKREEDGGPKMPVVGSDEEA